MRFVTWNCAQKFREKCAHMTPLRPDILAVQEVERFAKYPSFASDPQFTFRDRVDDVLYNRRGVGLFSYTPVGALITPVDAESPDPSFRRYHVAHTPHPFQVIAVWTAPTSGPRSDWYMQANKGMTAHMDWVTAVHTVVMGDFNKNASYRSGDWKGLQTLMEQAGLVSAYHEKNGVEFGKEASRTYFHWRKVSDSAQHIDYIFVPKDWLPHITQFEVGTHQAWCGEQMSDHVPLIMDVDI